MLYDWENTTGEIAAARPEIAILPLGSTEQNGPHLPVGTSTLILDAIAQRVGRALEANVYVLPTMPLGTSGSHMPAAGTVALRWETLAEVLRDLVESLLAQGIRKLVILVGLGNVECGTAWPADNFIAKATVRQLNYDHPDLMAVWVQPFAVAADEFVSIFETADREVHAGEAVTSVMLHLLPETVGRQMKDHIPGVTAENLNYLPFSALCPDGVWGCPSLASPEKGAQAMEAAVQCTVDYITRTFGQLGAMRSHR
jgi:creatinine amidohydrolase